MMFIVVTVGKPDRLLTWKMQGMWSLEGVVSGGSYRVSSLLGHCRNNLVTR